MDINLWVFLNIEDISRIQRIFLSTCDTFLFSCLWNVRLLNRWMIDTFFYLGIKEPIVPQLFVLITRRYFDYVALLVADENCYIFWTGFLAFPPIVVVNDWISRLYHLKSLDYTRLHNQWSSRTWGASIGGRYWHTDWKLRKYFNFCNKYGTSDVWESLRQSMMADEI